jgi:hypothetical protein
MRTGETALPLEDDDSGVTSVSSSSTGSEAAQDLQALLGSFVVVGAYYLINIVAVVSFCKQQVNTHALLLYAHRSTSALARGHSRPCRVRVRVRVFHQGNDWDFTLWNFDMDAYLYLALVPVMSVFVFLLLAHLHSFVVIYRTLRRLRSADWYAHTHTTSAAHHSVTPVVARCLLTRMGAQRARDGSLGGRGPAVDGAAGVGLPPAPLFGRQRQRSPMAGRLEDLAHQCPPLQLLRHLRGTLPTLLRVRARAHALAGLI